MTMFIVVISIGTRSFKLYSFRLRNLLNHPRWDHQPIQTFSMAELFGETQIRI